ncbi:MAG: inositol monophosphatase [Candidatus Omnitrophica bacterium]|jgi:myo-inositol-1(or 4)-monophosphatase|nr:inositol monophosphatase [Candidatus Omnitrophota bacterium]
MTPSSQKFTSPARHYSAVRAAVQKSAKLIRRHYGRLAGGDISSKSKNDFVTVVDKGSQDILVRELSRVFPSYGFLCEEDGLSVDAERRWVIDPIDGTSNFIHHLPAFCISVGLEENGRYVLGVVYDPLHDEWFYAAKGHGAFLNGRRIRVSANRVKDGFLATGFAFHMADRFEPYNASFRKVFHACAGVRRMGSAAIDLCYTACGRFDGFWEMGLHDWDIAAAVVIVEEAGGKVTDFRGGADGIRRGDMLAANPMVHRELLKILSGVPLLAADEWAARGKSARSRREV